MCTAFPTQMSIQLMTICLVIGCLPGLTKYPSWMFFHFELYISPKLVRLKMKLLTFLAFTLLAVNVFVVADNEKEGKYKRFNFATNTKK